MWPASNSSSSSGASRLRVRRSRSRPPRRCSSTITSRLRATLTFTPARRWPTIMIETMMSRPLLALLHLCDSLFPIGGFGYSDGLEAATAAGLVETPADLQAWLDVSLDETVGRMDGPAALRAWSAFDRPDWQA